MSNSELDQKNPVNLSRRNFLTVSAGVSGALVINFAIPKAISSALAATNENAAVLAAKGLIKIDEAGLVTLIMPYVEMGQGTYTSIPMLIAEELEVDVSKVSLEHAPPDDKLYANPAIGIQITGGSTSIRAAWTPMRKAGALAKNLLITAAAQQYKVDPALCKAELGNVILPDGKKVPYGKLVKVASTLPLPNEETLVLKDPKDFKIIGKPVKRLDTKGKTNGTAMYGLDVKLPNMKVATIKQSPYREGKLKSVDTADALAVKGVRQIVQLDNCVAVVADHMGAAKKGMNALKITWDPGKYAKLSTEDIVEDMKKASDNRGAIATKVGDFDQSYGAAKTHHEAVYEAPFLAHATMEPMNCTVDYKKDSCEIWVGTQVIGLAQMFAAQVTGLPAEKVKVNNFLIGGGFGRRLEVDGVVLAVKVAMQVNGPVKVIWTREEDIQQDMYRPYFYDKLSVGLNEAGYPVAWNHRITGSSVLGRYLPPAFNNGFDPETIDGSTPPYDIPNLLVDYNRHEPAGMPTAFWRGVGPTHNVFMVESMIDELAHLAKIDPVEYRLNLLSKNPRAHKVLKLAAEKSGWGTPSKPGYGRGVSVQFAFGTYMAQVVELKAEDEDEVKVEKVTCVVDTGIVINPDTVQAQVESSIVFGLSAGLYGKITLKNGQVQQSNFHDYKPLRMNEMPIIDTVIVQSAEAPGGMGEPGTSALKPALANAYFAATGKRVRKLPLMA